MCKKFIRIQFEDKDGEVHAADYVTYGPPVFMKFKTEKQDGWILYCWSITADGSSLSLYDPQTRKIACYHIAAYELNNTRRLQFFVPKATLSLWVRIKARSDASIKYHCYEVEMEADLIDPECEKYEVNIMVTEFHKDSKTKLHFQSILHRREEVRRPESVNVKYVY